MVKAVKSFFSKVKLLREVIHTFITLVPKTTNASQLSDSRLISCCNALHKLIRYLGLPLAVDYLKARHFITLIDKCRSKPEGWTSRTLSVAGRAELMKAAIANIVANWTQSFQFPKLMLKEVENTSANFIGTKQMHARGWNFNVQTKIRRRLEH